MAGRQEFRNVGTGQRGLFGRVILYLTVATNIHISPPPSDSVAVSLHGWNVDGAAVEDES